mgnify:CR=1 FL=1
MTDVIPKICVNVLVKDEVSVAFIIRRYLHHSPLYMDSVVRACSPGELFKTFANAFFLDPTNVLGVRTVAQF